MIRSLLAALLLASLFGAFPAIAQDMDSAASLEQSGEQPDAGMSVDDGAKAVENFERAAATGNVPALVRLGEIYRNGALVPADAAKAFAYFEKAAAQGSAAGKLRLGEAYVAGSGVQADPARGIRLIEEAAQAGDTRAFFRLGDIYSNGEAVSADGPRAIQNFERAAATGNLLALVRLGDIYRDGLAVPPDATKAYAFFSQAAENGLPIAKVRLGEALIRGRDVERDVQAGVALITEAAESGDRIALYLTGELLSRGEFVTPDMPKALASYESAGEAGYAPSYVRLGEIYRDGVLVDKDAAKSMAFYEKAIALGFGRAAVVLGENHANRRYGSASKTKAGVALIEDAMQDGEPTASPALANLYLWGVGVRQNSKTAVQILTRAADAGNPEATKLLIAYYRDGRRSLIDKSTRKASELLSRYSVNFNAAENAAEEILLASALARGRGDFERIGKQIDELPSARRPAVVSALRTANSNLFVYVVQTRLTQRGIYDGPINGVLTSSTVRAVQKLCQQTMLERVCRKGPLSPEASTFVAQLIG